MVRENLRATVAREDAKSNILKIPIECNEEFLLQAFLNFHRMNINYAGLFPVSTALPDISGCSSPFPKAFSP